MKFHEELPARCPPAAAADIAYEEVWRVVAKQQCDADEFKSHLARGQKCPPGISECDFASCSMFTDVEKARKIATRLPKKRYPKPYLARLSIPAGAGLSLQDQKTTHVHFWIYEDFDPLSVVQEVREA